MTDLKSDVMTELGFALFDTPIDCCGIVWNGRGIAGVQLPETDRRAVRNRVLLRFPGACEAVPPADVQRVVDDIARLLNGEPRDLDYAKIDTAAAGVSPPRLRRGADHSGGLDTVLRRDC